MRDHPPGLPSAPRALSRLLGIAALCAAVVAVACAQPEPPPSMVIVVIDTLRADHLGLYGYQAHPTSPNLDARAASAAVFERAFSTAPWTLPAFGTLFTGQIPTRHSAGVFVHDIEKMLERADPRELVEHSARSFYRLDREIPTLGGTLQAAGYSTAAIMNNAFLSPEFGLSRGFDTYDYDPELPDKDAASATDRALAWLQAREQEGAREPFLLIVHYFDPHMPYAAPEPFLGRFAEPYADERFSVPVTDMPRLRYRIRDRVEGWQRYMALEQALYDEEIAYTDNELERLLGALDERRFLDDGYLLVTADHGEEFHDHGWIEHGHSVYDEVIHVPLMVWGPDVRPGRYELPVSLTDVMPTLLEAAGVARPDDLYGDSLLQVLREGPADRTASALRFDRPLLSEAILYGDEKKSLIRWPYKVLADIEDRAELFYDLETDPEELDGHKAEQLDHQSRDRMLTMLAELQAIIVDASSQSSSEGASLSEETLDRLRALGYIR
ncbi:MAG: sulfatase [Acidobacteriota bacterium]